MDFSLFSNNELWIWTKDYLWCTLRIKVQSSWARTIYFMKGLSTFVSNFFSSGPENCNKESEDWEGVNTGNLEDKLTKVVPSSEFQRCLEGWNLVKKPHRAGSWTHYWIFSIKVENYLFLSIINKKRHLLMACIMKL